MRPRVAHLLSALAPLLVAGPGVAAAQSFNQMFVFGDSSVDSGYYRVLATPGGGATYNSFWAAAVAAGAGQPTNSPGLMNSQVLASYFGLAATPANQGGTNYATSGAKNVTVNTALTSGFQAAIPTTVQIANYLAAGGGAANPNALYYFSSGGNDITYATSATPPPNPTAYLTGAASSLAASIASIQAAGGRYIIVAGLPYSFPSGPGAANATQRQDKLLYTQSLFSSLAADGVNFVPADVNAVRLAIAANPAAFGFAFVDTAAGHMACTKPAGVTSAWALLCSANPASPSHLVSPNAQLTDLFADDQHYTTAGQKIMADYEYSLLVAPSQMSFLAEVAVKTRTGVINAILNQIPVSQRASGPGGFNGWASGDLSYLRMANYPGFPDDPGNPIATTGGFDYRFSAAWLVGAAFSVGTAQQSFGLGAGTFTQDEVAASLYAAYRDEPVWANAVATWGGMRDSINRLATIGITIQPNVSNTWGRNASVALETGYDIVQPWLTHGPVVGVTLQQVRVNGFTEAGGFTALAFAAQMRDSTVSALGYQASFDAGLWRPFVKAVWNHEFAPTDRVVTAYLTTLAAPGFSLPAVTFEKDWASAQLGTTLKMPNSVTGLLAVYSQLGQRGVVNYGAQAGFSVALGDVAPQGAAVH
jgi:outer membrane lipase/esterase